MNNNTLLRRVAPAALAAALTAAFATGGALAAGRGAGGGPPAGVGGGMMGQPHGPASMPGSNNPNGMPPIGRPASPGPDTDRGHSEGQGKNDQSVAANVRPTVGKVASFSGTTLTLKLPNGTTKTFTVNEHAFGQLKPAAGQDLAVRSKNGTDVDSVVPANTTITGSVKSVTRSAVTLLLPNGRTVTVNVAPQAVAHLKLTPGSQATLVSQDGGFSVSGIRSGNH
ncbi:MAG: hypothetical protein NVSMB31_04360 [Vulcanimicrobiaceae bacterium]